MCDRDLRVQFLSGFTGSNAFVVVTQQDALLWTDGRYFVQVKQKYFDRFRKFWNKKKFIFIENLTNFFVLKFHIFTKFFIRGGGGGEKNGL